MFFGWFTQFDHRVANHDLGAKRGPGNNGTGRHRDIGVNQPGARVQHAVEPHVRSGGGGDAEAVGVVVRNLYAGPPRQVGGQLHGRRNVAEVVHTP